MTLLVIICGALSAAFFAGLETGLLSADQLSIYLKKEKGIYYARAADFLLLKPERLLSTTLIGTNLSIVAVAIMVASFLRERGLQTPSWLTSLVLSLVLLIITEIIPKSFLRRNANTVAVRLAPVLVVFYFVFLVPGFILNTLVKVLLVFSTPKKGRSKLPQSREDLRLLVRLGSRESGFGSREHRIFEDIFDFRSTLAREVMTPMHEYPVCPATATIAEVVTMTQRNRIRFIPVFKERADNIVGYVDVDRLLSLESSGNGRSNISSLVAEAVFYPDVKRIPDLLLAMNRHRLEVVFLSDEYGSVSGLITPAEIAAEIVGFVPGEPFPPQREIQALEPGHYVVAGTTDIEDLYHEAGIHLKKGNYDTVGGFLCEQLGEIPPVGATYEQGGFLYRVLDRDERHIREIEIVRKAGDAAKKKT
jgi:putative hemolysin